MLHADFNFHPIGQGGFCTGNIYYNNVFNFVYDCGTLSERPYLLDSVENFKRNLHRKTLDLLILSHLDDDHVNGIKNLLDGVICERIYLPYLTPIQRLCVVIRHNTWETNNFDDFINFLKSPHGYILNIEKSQIKEINYIFGNSDDSYGLENENIKPINPKGKDLEFQDNLESIPNNELLPEMKQILGNRNSKVKFKKGNRPLLLSRVWEFFLYHETTDEVNLNLFISELNQLYGINIDLQLTQAQLVNILDDRDKLTELRKIFRRNFKNINKTGLVLQHKPVGYRNAELFKESTSRYFHHYFNPFYRCYLRNRFINRNNPIDYKWGVSLLTGDICLNQIESSSYIKNHLEKVLVFQVPHHGAETGWITQYLNRLNANGMTTSVINFGYGNTYGHPKPKVLTSLDDRNFDIRFCNQFESFKYHFRLFFNYER